MSGEKENDLSSFILHQRLEVSDNGMAAVVITMQGVHSFKCPHCESSILLPQIEEQRELVYCNQCSAVLPVIH